MNLNKVFVTTFIFLISILSSAQSVEGNWEGVVKTPYVDIPIVAHFVKDGKVWLATLDSPEQNAFDIPADSVAINGDSVYFELARMRVTYRGKIVHKDTINGLFTQGKRSQSIVLVKTGGKVKSAYLQGFTTKELLIENQEAKVTLSATLTYPKKGRNFPTVILVSGSGPQDRNASMFGQKPFKDLAEKLTRSGFAVLRFDERGVAKSSGNYSKATTQDLAKDVESIFYELQRCRKLDKNKIGILGHSEGSMIAAMVASRNKDVAFAISMGGPGMPFDDLMLLQYKKFAEAAGMENKDIISTIRLNKAIFDLAKTSIDSATLATKINALVVSKLIKDSLKISADSFNTLTIQTFKAYNIQVNNPWWRFVLKVNPLEYWAKVECPVYILNGYLDLQVPSSLNVLNIENQLNRNGNFQTQKKGYPGLNHLFQKAKKGMLEEYSSGQKIFDAKVQNDIVDWLNGLWIE